MKKTLSLILTVIILLSSFSLQSFALLGFDKIEKVDVKSCEEFSLKEIREYIAEFEGEEMEEEDKEYPIACEADVTISTGEVISVKDMNFGYSENNKRIYRNYLYFFLIISYNMMTRKKNSYIM